MSGSRAGAGAAASSSAGIPSNARKVVLQLKEVVQGTDDEIYAVLRDCNMDPNEAVQRLLNQDPFHEVKRRRDKKKEVGGSKDGTESRTRPANGASSSRGGRSGLSERGVGRGSAGPRYPTDHSGGGRGKQFMPRENGIHPSNRVPSAAALVSSSTCSSLPKAFPPGSSNVLPPAPSSVPVPAAVSAPVPVPGATPSPSAVASTSLTNGNSIYSRPSPVAQGSWGSGTGHATMADIVKSNGAPPPVSAVTAVPQQQYVPPSGSVSSGVYSSSTDPVLHPYLDSRASGTPGGIKRDLGTVGNQRPIGDRPSVSAVSDGNSIASPSLQAHLPAVSATSSGSPNTLESEVPVPGPNSPSATPAVQERTGAQSLASESSNGAGSLNRQTSGAVPSSVSGTPVRTVLSGGQFSGRAGYQTQQQPVGALKSTGSSLEWKPKPVSGLATAVGTSSNSVTQPEATRAPAPSAAQDTSTISAASAKLQSLNIQDDQQVIIPNHLQVPESDITCLSFGSFGAGFGGPYSSNFGPDEPSKNVVSMAEDTPLAEAPVEQPSTSTCSASPVTLSQAYSHQSVSSPVDSLVPSSDVTVSLPVPVVPQLELTKPDPIVQQSHHYPYLPTVANYPGFGLVPQIPSQYTYEPPESQPQDVSRLPNLMAYTDPAASYYTPAFRPGSDGDTRYPPFLTSNATSKFNGNMNIQSLQSSQEASNPLSSSGPSIQSSQSGNAQSVPSMPQQPLPMHPYAAQPAGVPLGHFTSVFGYQYVPSSYTYMHHPPYQHNYTGNSGYQPPSGTSYPQAAGSSYPPAGAGAVKYSLPPYKPGSASGNALHSAAASGYGGYTAAPSGYAANPTVTAGSATGFEDVSVQPYKDNIYIPSQQAEGSVWIQTQLSRDMAGGGMQTSSYYNIPTQGQHAGYAHTQPTHAHGHPSAGYASLYHPSQSGPAPSAHQLLQQPQALGGGGGGGGQGGAYQQSQRAQQTWTNNY